ncbi:hypothetical protein LJR220_005358 [Bradyrhizobium sp. LjRoot220]|uniref:imm11 family protein n=1 Tax=Bradyrhizobium sp. LjRoot220 TaxID=3342284 RepID=UPI003ECFB561
MRVWFSGVMGNYLIGNKQGLRHKFYGKDWAPAQHILAPLDEKAFAAMERHAAGYPLERSDLPEASAVFDKKCFSRVRDLFVVGGIFVVRERLAEVFARFDLGDGGLVPLTIYQEDLTTPVQGKFYFLNLGARKRSVLPSESKNVKLVASNSTTGIEIWKVNPWAEDGDVALSEAALGGADLWVEEIARDGLFMSEALAAALREAKFKTDYFELKECRIVDKTR